jgi:molecular chaperone DnaJ
LAKQDYYDVLGVQKTADESEIKKAYRQQAKKYHPDVNPGDKQAEQKFKDVNEAYEVLSDGQKRKQYDQFGHDAFSQGAAGGANYGGAGFGDFGDIFENFFGGSFGFGGNSGRRNGPVKGSDYRVNLTITFEQAVFGEEREIDVNRDEDCPDCKGSGAASPDKIKTCTHCHGTGTVQQQMNTIFGTTITSQPCPVCQGDGKVIEQPCTACRGKGTVRKRRKLKVNIPAGIDNGQVITLRGEGAPGQRGGPKGDLYVYITVRPHKTFVRDGYDLHMDLVVSFAQAALGDEIEISTLEGKLKYKMEEGTQPNTTARLRGKGIKHLRSSQKGDLLLHIKVDIPKKLNEKQKNLIREFDKALVERKSGLFGKRKEA